MKKALVKGLVWLRSKYNELLPRKHPKVKSDKRKTYDIGIVLMLLEAYYVETILEDDKYVRGVNKRKIPPFDLSWVREMVDWLAKWQNINANKVNPASAARDGVWRYPTRQNSLVDNSNSQYAVLGLKAASRMGVHIKNSKVWIEVVEYFIRTQDKKGPKIKRKPPAEDPKTGKYHFPKRYEDEYGSDEARGWGYLPKHDEKHPSTGSMTTAALAALITAKSELYNLKVLPKNKKLEERIDKSINDGICWLGHHFSVKMNPDDKDKAKSWHYYYLYGLERAGILAQTEFFGQHAWYVEGAKYLIENQKTDGHWEGGTKPISDTCFALLFLKRATVPVKIPLKIQKPVITGDPKNKNK